MFLISTLLNNLQPENPEKDLVESLPEYSYTGKLYSGYLKAGPVKYFHYMFNVADEDPEEKPLVLWLNGGPGCSSLDGWSVENGPMFLNTNGTFRMNEYSWNKAANMLYIESPGGVGYSFINSSSEEDNIINDDIAAKDNLNALLSFFKKFPEYQKKDFYISGESYAGVYIPTLSIEIINYNKNVPEDYKINLKGILVGNGVTDLNYDTTPALFDFAFSHHITSYEYRINFNEYCNFNYNKEKCDNLQEYFLNITSNLNYYNYIEECEKPTDENGEINFDSNYFLKNSWAFKNFKRLKVNLKPKNRKLEEINIDNDTLTAPCCNDVPMIKYFNREDVKKALHVNLTKGWNMCSKKVNEGYLWQDKTSIWAYQTLFENNIRILIFNGDTDMVCAFNGNIEWIENLNLDVIEPWRSWRAYGDENNIAGYVTKYKGLTFCTVKGAGHEVPKYKPKESYYMFSKFIQNEQF